MCDVLFVVYKLTIQFGERLENGCVVVVRVTPMESLDLRTEFWTIGAFLHDSGNHEHACRNELSVFTVW